MASTWHGKNRRRAKQRRRAEHLRRAFTQSLLRFCARYAQERGVERWRMRTTRNGVRLHLRLPAVCDHIVVDAQQSTVTPTSPGATVYKLVG